MQVTTSTLVVILLAGFASQGGRATVTYQPTPLKGDGQGCPSDENMAQAIENIHSLIEERVETESTPETRLLTELNTAVETLSQEVAELANDSQTVNGTLTELISRDETATILQVINDNPRGLSQVLPAGSCRAISENRPDLPSGNYWIRSSDGNAIQVYCDMSRLCCNETTEGWTRVAFLNMTDPNQQCPQAWRELLVSGVRSCARTSTTSASCDSAFYANTGGNSYSQVCGRVTGYQYCVTDAFGFLLENDTETFYVDGVSITHGSPRQHVWSFAAAISEISTSNVACPCIGDANPHVPSFVGDDFFCDTGTVAGPGCRDIETDLITDFPLWDGGGCGPTGGCCESNNPPWFCKTLPQPTTDDIEVRICADESLANEDVAVGLIEIYVH